MLCNIYSNFGIKQTLFIYSTWLVVTIFILIVLAKSLTTCFALATICFLPSFCPIQTPRNLTASFSFVAYTSYLSTITLRSSILDFAFIVISLDLDRFIWISFILKKSSAILIISSSCSFELAIYVVSSAKATTACLTLFVFFLFFSKFSYQETSNSYPSRVFFFTFVSKES